MLTGKAKTPAVAGPRPRELAASLQQRIETFVEQASAWVVQHSLQILVALAIGVAIVAVLIGIKRLGMRLCREGTANADWRTIIGRVIAQTRFLFMVVLAAHLVAGYAYAPDAVANTIRFLFVIGLTLQAALWARELILGLVEHRVSRGGDSDHSALGSAIGIIRLLVTVALFAIAIILVLDNLGVNVTGLVAGLGIGGIAIGLAAQGIFSDLFAALAILFDRPFRRGDAIRWDTTSGTVEAIGLKTTRVRALTGEEVVISNANLLNKELHNLARLDRRRLVHKLGVTYQTTPDMCDKIPEMLRAIVEGHDRCTLVRCGMIGFAASSLDFELQFDVHSDVYDVVFATQSKVLIAILKAFNTAGIEFAYPTQTTFTAAPDGRLVMPYAEPPILMEQRHAPAPPAGER
ncbi:MAG: mechanosensitive ion channel MscS [Sphingomonas bacterium]|nr:mechanosensitive ion channel family protein [Sphingomonas bacterium]MDB5688518.1 mechanosensitive ion channel MscS [Sphingomonas bacterium]